MSDNTAPTPDEVREAIAVIERATGHKQTYNLSQTRAMSKEQIAAALERNPAAFDTIHEVDA